MDDAYYRCRNVDGHEQHGARPQRYTIRRDRISAGQLIIISRLIRIVHVDQA